MGAQGSTPTTPVTLTIQAGVEVRFTSGKWLQIGSGTNQGSLDAQGTAASNVVFTSDQTTKTPGYWGGIRVESSSTALLQYSTIEYGGAGGFGMVYVNGASPTLQNCTIRNGSSYGNQVISGGLSLDSVTMSGTGGTYSVTMPLTTSVTSTGTHTIDKPIELRSGTISANTTWKNVGVPYVLSGTSYVYKDPTTASTLTVDPGVEVRFGSGVWLQVGLGTSLGTLNAQGTATSPVLFTSNQATKTPGYWGGLRFDPGATATSLLQYSTLEYGGAGSFGMVYVNGSSPTLQNCTIRNGSSYGIQVISGGLSLASVTLSGTGATYSVTMPLTTSVTSTGTHAIDKPIELRPGTISVNTTWKNLGAPYVVTGTSYVYNTTTGSILTVDPGVEVRFGSGVWLQVGSGTSLGALNAQGTVASPVLFTSNQTTKTPGYWGGLRFDPGSASTSLLQYTTIEYGGNGGFGMVYVNGSSPTLQNCTIRQSGADGVTALGASAPALKASSFTSNALAAVNNTGSLTVDAGASWWAHISGPSGGGPGSGQKIAGNVIYSPWLEAAPKPALHATSGQITKFLFDKTDDATAFVATLNKTANWTLTVKDQNNTTKKTYSGSGASINQTWNGEQTGTSTKVPDGLYTLRLTAIASGTTMAPLVGRVRVTSTKAPVAAITTPTSNGVVTGGTSVSVIGTAADVNDFVSYLLEYGSGPAPTSWIVITPTATTPVTEALLGTWATPVSANGSYTLRLTANDASSPPTVLTQPVRVMAIFNPQASGLYFSPNGDGVADTFSVTATLSLSANWTLTFKNSSGATVRTYTGTNATSVSQAWDGKNASGSPVPDATYTYTLSAVEPGSGVPANAFTGTVTVDRTAPTASITAPASGATVFDTITITGTASDVRSFNNYTVEYGAGSAPTAWTALVTSSVQVTAGTLKTWITQSYIDEILVPGGNGTYTIRLTVRDFAGNVATAQVTINLDDMLIYGVSRAPATIRPAAGDTSTISFTLNQPASVTLRIHAEPTTIKVYPDQTPESGALRTISMGSLPAGAQTVVWDGKDDAGAILPEEAYIYIIEARAPSGRFDKFNRYIQAQATFSLSGTIIPSSAAVCNAWTNTFFSHAFSVSGGPARGSTIVFDVATYGQVLNYNPQYQQVWIAGTNTFFWDCRDANGSVVTVPVNMVYPGSLVHQPFRGLNANYILVQGGLVRLPGDKVQSDPYRIHLSYGHVVHIKYELLDNANVTIVIGDPGTGAQTTVLNNVAQTVGPQDVIWDGLAGNGLLVPTEGHYMFTISATIPASGVTVVRRGNLTIYR